MSESGYRPSTNEIREQAEMSAKKSKIKRDEEKNRKLSLKQKAGRIAATAMLTAASGAIVAGIAHSEGENSVKRDIGVEYAGDIDKNVELSLLPDRNYHVEGGDSVIGIYHKLPYAENGFSLDAFMAEVEKRNPGITGTEGRNDWEIDNGQNLNIPKLSE